MKKVIVLFFAFSFCFGQKATISLEKINNYKKRDTTKVEMMIDFCVSNVFSNQKQNLDIAKKALQMSKEIDYVLGEMRSLNCIGNYYYQQAIYPQAIYYYTSSLKIAEKRNDIKNIIIGKSNLASVYTRTNSAKKALVLFHEIDADLLKSGGEYTQNRAAILTNMGMAYSSVNEHEKAIVCHKKTLEICKKKNIVFGIALAESNIGEELIRHQQPIQSLPYLISSKKLSEKNGFDNFLGQIYKNLGEVYWIKKRQDSAIIYLNKAVQICKKINDQNSLLSASKILHGYYAAQQNYKKAYATSLDFISVNDSVNNKEKQNSITEINTKYETEKKEAQIKSLSQQKKIATLESQRQKNIALLLTIALFSILVTAYFLFNRYKIKSQNDLLKTQLVEAEKTIEAEKKATESELKALKSQMNPHFIFNALSSIQDQFMFGDKVTANEQMGNFTYLTRQILNVSGKKQILLSMEIDILSKYLELEKMRFKTDFSYTITTSGAIDPDYHEIPPMLIQPFVENSIKHGLLHQSGHKKVSIHFDLDDNENYISCTITDNGIGREKSAGIKAKNQNSHQSFSTASIEQRLELLNENLKLDSLITYTDVLQDGVVTGTKVVVNIPLG